MVQAIGEGGAAGGANTFAPAACWNETGERDHFVQFYEADEFLLDSLSGYAREGIEAGEACVVVARPGRLEGLDARLRACGLDPDEARASGRLFTLDAAETLSRFMRGDAPDPCLFEEVVGGVLSRASREGRRVRAFGEMVALLWADGKPDAAIRLEGLWNGLAKARAFRLFCAYPLNGFEGETHAGPLGRVCAEHTHVIPAESYTSLPGADERLRAITELQRKARTLEAEIAERRAVEAELRALKEELEAQVRGEQAARAEAERANRLKDEFLLTVSHELRTPLTAVLGWTHLLVKTRLDDATAARALDAIERNAMTQAQLVEDILDVSRAVTGKLRLEVGPVDLAAVVNHAVDSVQHEAESKGMSLEVTLDASARHVEGDAGRLRQVVSKLLSNAIKFTPPRGRVLVRLSRADSQVEIAVSDTGQGIAPDFLPYVFDRFRQADQSTTRCHGGLGLGLALVRHLVELHGGAVRAESQGEGRGSTFTVTLPA
ncbi:MAG TPA: ATP-binding protein [Pyrinomonadaceae bacterium]|nr:ATP-binding protein [Pyrinomonadaceae bacterium]